MGRFAPTEKCTSRRLWCTAI